MSKKQTLQDLIQQARDAGTSEEIIETLIPTWVEQVTRDEMGLSSKNPEPTPPSELEQFVRNEMERPSPTPVTDEEVTDADAQIPQEIERETRRDMRLAPTKAEPVILPSTPEEKVMYQEFPATWREKKQQLLKERESHQ